MCVIIDTNMVVNYIDETEDMRPLRQRIENKKIKLISPPENNNFWSEYEKNIKFARLLIRYKSKNIMKIIPSEKLEQAERELNNSEVNFKSNKEDLSILALAKASNTKLLVTHDKPLMKDFKNPSIIGGSIYQYKTQTRLLDNNKCP